MRKVNSGAKLMPQQIPRPKISRQPRNHPKVDKNEDDVLRSLEPTEYQKAARNQTNKAYMDKRNSKPR